MELTPKYHQISVCVRACLRKALHGTALSILSTVHTVTIMNAVSNEAVVLLSHQQITAYLYH